MSGHPCVERLLLPEALSGRLDPAEEKRVMAHVDTCATCQDAATEIDIALISLEVLREARSGSPARPVTPAPAAASAPLPPALVTVGPEGGPDGRAEGIAEAPPAQPAQPDELQARRLRRRSRVLTGLVAAAAAVLLVAGGAVVGHQLLPPRDDAKYGPALALSAPPGAADPTAHGTVAIASEGNTLAVKLSARSLPTAGWYECVWLSGNESRSAGSFRASGGAANVELRVAPPKDSAGWQLQVIAHTGTASQVVLEGSAATPS